VEGAVAAIGADGEGLGIVLEGVWRGLGADVVHAQGLALLDESEGGVRAGALDGAGSDVAGDAEIFGVGAFAHGLQFGDGDVVALAIPCAGDGEPGDRANDDDGGDDELDGGFLHSISLAREQQPRSSHGVLRGERGRFADGVDAELELEGYGQRALLVAGLLCEVEETDDAVGVFSGDGERDFAANSVADVGVEEAVVARDGRVGLA